MNGDFPMDMSQIERNIAAAEVIAVYFPFLGKTLLVDTRYDEVEGPLVKLVPVAQSIEERFKTLTELRPRFPRPQSIAVVPWPRYVRALERSGIWERIIARLDGPHSFGLVEECRLLLRELERLEREEIVAAVKGEGYRTIWQVDRG